MEITRHGNYRNHGEETILPELELKSAEHQTWHNNAKWDKTAQQIVISAGRVPHTHGSTKHEYTIRLSLSDIISFIHLLGHDGTHSNSLVLSESLASQVPALVKLLACANGLVASPIENSSLASSQRVP